MPFENRFQHNINIVLSISRNLRVKDEYEPEVTEVFYRTPKRSGKNIIQNLIFIIP